MGSGTFDGKRALVTGGTRGMGFGIARRLVAEGAAVCLVARHRDDLVKAAAEIRQPGADCEFISADLATVEGAESAAAEALSKTRRWDILVNAAGNPPGPSLLEMDTEFWDETFGVHLRAPFILSRALVPGMIEAGGGSILNISSTAGLMGALNHGAYSPAKAGLNMLTCVMAMEWGPHDVRTNAICPTLVLTELGMKVWGAHPEKAEWLKKKIPLGRFAEVSDVVELARFLLAPENSFINGAIVPCDGGLTAGAGFSDGPP